MKDTENRTRTVTVVKKADESEGESRSHIQPIVVIILSQVCLVQRHGQRRAITTLPRPPCSIVRMRIRRRL